MSNKLSTPSQKLPMIMFLLGVMVLSLTISQPFLSAQEGDLETNPFPQQGGNRVYLSVISGTGVWQRVGPSTNPPGVTLYYDVAVCEEHYLAGANNGLYNYKKDGNVWQVQQPPNGASPSIVSGVVFRPGSNCSTAYAASRTHGVWQGTRNGNNWTWTSVGQGVNEAFVVLVSDNMLYAAGNFGIARTPLPADTSSVWQFTNIETPTYGLNVSLSNEDVIHAAVWNRGVVEKSPSDPGQWNDIGSTVIPNRLVYDASANDTGIILAGTDRGLMRWIPSAWTSVAAQFTSTNFTTLAVGRRFYAGQSGIGVIYSLDDGATWAQMSSGLTVDEAFRVRRLRLSSDGKLHAATSKGIFVWQGTP